MAILGLLLILAVGGLSLAVILADDGVLLASAGIVDLFGYQMEPTVGQVFLIGAAAGALLMLGLSMVLGGMGRAARRRSAGRSQLRTQRQEMRDLERKHDVTASELAARDAADDAADRDRVKTGS